LRAGRRARDLTRARDRSGGARARLRARAREWERSGRWAHRGARAGLGRSGATPLAHARSDVDGNGAPPVGEDAETRTVGELKAKGGDVGPLEVAQPVLVALRPEGDVWGGHGRRGINRSRNRNRARNRGLEFLRRRERERERLRERGGVGCGRKAALLRRGWDRIRPAPGQRGRRRCGSCGRRCGRNGRRG